MEFVSYGKSANTTSEWLLLARGGNDAHPLEQVKKQFKIQIASGTIQYIQNFRSWQWLHFSSNNPTY